MIPYPQLAMQRTRGMSQFMNGGSRRKLSLFWYTINAQNECRVKSLFLRSQLVLMIFVDYSSRR
jgi:hypothetical protein